jgi:hypothetical protein
MQLQKITDKNLSDFLKGDKMILFLTLSYCPYCHAYMDKIKPALNDNPKIKFGEAAMDKPGVEKIEANLEMPDYYPTAILFNMGKEVCRLESRAGDPTTLEEFKAAIDREF